MDVKGLFGDGFSDSPEENVKDIIIPSEEEHIEMFPLDFKEFLWAMGMRLQHLFIRECFENEMPLGQGAHRKVMNSFSPVSSSW